MVACGQQLDGGTGVVTGHLAPVQHLVALGNHGKVALGVADVGHFLRLQLVHIHGVKRKALLRVVPQAVVTDISGQIARRVHGRIEQHRLAAQSLGQPSGIKPAQ